MTTEWDLDWLIGKGPPITGLAPIDGAMPLRIQDQGGKPMSENGANDFVTTVPQDGVVRVIGYSTAIGLGGFGRMPLGVLPVAEDAMFDLAVLLVQGLESEQLEELRGIVGF